jgi:hypothetical protein
MSLAIAAATADPIVALHPLVPPGFTHQVVALAGIAKPATSPTQSTIVAATERMFPFIAIPPCFVFGVNSRNKNHITAEANAERELKESRSETV